ncbi:MAG: alpha/beta fold hydrolase [Gemmatimonadota bacterium]|nr:alpha/beta fold hydrolase [Gemmatimonadota bacterium]
MDVSSLLWGGPALLVVAWMVGVYLFSRLVLNPKRHTAWSDPRAELGLDFEAVRFPARDGLMIEGWFIPGPHRTEGPAAIIMHGWPWNRMGTPANRLLWDLPGSTPVRLMPLAGRLHSEGYHVVMFDVRNYGESGSDLPQTYGWKESLDLLGALDMLEARDEVDASRMGVVGFSMGGNSLIYATGGTDQIRAGVAIQPTTPQVFSRRYRKALLGPLSYLLYPPVEVLYRLRGGPKLTAFDLRTHATMARSTPILYLQGSGDKWGSVEDVQAIAAATPNASEPILLPTEERFGGYMALVDRPEPIIDFFAPLLSPTPATAGQEAVAH